MRLAALVLLLALLGAGTADAATLRPIGEFDQPTSVSSDPGNPESLFVVEREGRVIRVENGVKSVFADLTSLVSCCDGERGLLSIAIAPDFDASGRFYAAYAGTPAAGGAEGDVHVDAFHHAGGALVREPLFSVEHSINANHNGGQLQIGPDGYLYVSVGDGGGEGDPFESGQDQDSLLGKILRIEPRAGAVPQVWSYGLRNPWRFSFDRANGNMVIGDVGQSAREEVDFASSPAPGVVGGYVVRDPSVADLFGRYVYADLCVGEIRSLLLPASAGGLASDDRSEGLAIASPVSFGEDSCGRVYVVAQDGPVYRFEGASPAVCPAASRPDRQSGSPISVAVRRRAGQLLLTVRRRHAGKRPGLLLIVRLAPCAGHAGEKVRLNRGGRPLAAKRLNSSCVARFQVRVSHRSTFRAVLGATYRSQVRTIALAKPRP